MASFDFCLIPIIIHPMILQKKSQADYYFSLIPVKNAANQVLGQVNIAPSSKQSTVIDLSIKGEVPKRGEDILNELLKGI